MRSTPRRGFTLVECMVSLLTIAFLLAGFYSLLSAAFASSALPSMTLNGTIYAKAPDLGQMNAAIQAQMLFQQLQQSADAILVFGGKGSHPLADPTGPSAVIDWNSWPTSLDTGPGGPAIDPARQFSSWDQRSAAGATVPAGSPADFSVVFVQGLNRIIGIAKQRRTLAPNGSHCYDVVVQATGGQPEGYHIYYPAAEDSWRIAPGAEHLWFRYDPTWDRDEEAGAFLVFADPHAVAGENPYLDAEGNPDSEVLPVSQFSFYVPVVN